MRDRVTELREQNDTRWLETATASLYQALNQHINQRANTTPSLLRACRTLLHHDHHLLETIKTTLSHTVAIFEEVGHRPLNEAAAAILNNCEALVATITNYHSHLNQQLRNDQEIATLLDRSEAITV